MMMNLFVMRAVATLVLTAQTVGMGAAAQAAGANTGAAAQVAPAGAVVQARGALYEGEGDEGTWIVVADYYDAAGQHHIERVHSVTGESWITVEPAPQQSTTAPGGGNLHNQQVLAELLQQYRAEEEARQKAEEEARRKAEAEAEAQRQAEAEAQRQAEEEARRTAEEKALQAAAQSNHGEAAVVPVAPEPGIIAPPAIIEVVEAETSYGVLEAAAEPASAPSAGNKADEKVEEKPGEDGLTPEEAQRIIEALTRQQRRSVGSNPGIGGQQRKKVVTYPPEESAKYKNNATDDQIARVDEFLEKYPAGTTWDNSAVYKNFGACAAYAFQAQHAAFGEDADYVWSKDPADIRQYSAVRISTPSSASHWVFVLKVNGDGTMTTAEGNVNGKVVINYTRVIDPNRIYDVWNPAK